MDSFGIKILSWLKSLRAPFRWIWGIIQLESRVKAIERKMAVETDDAMRRSFRKCPKCAERDFRLRDEYRSRPDVYGPRFLHQKWLCYSCGYSEAENIPEPE